jgi:hypothetical protein
MRFLKGMVTDCNTKPVHLTNLTLLQPRKPISRKDLKKGVMLQSWTYHFLSLSSLILSHLLPSPSVPLPYIPRPSATFCMLLLPS